MKEILQGVGRPLRTGIKVIHKNGLHYIVGERGRVRKFKPWLGDAFSFLYDPIMERSIFPKKFGGDIKRHYEILGKELQGLHERRVLELAAGSGSAANFLPNDNPYAGTDISPGLLKRAVKSFQSAGFKDAAFYVAGAEDLPFADNVFDIVLCILSLNFFNDIETVFKEVQRVADRSATFICSVPVPERNKAQRTIRGRLYSEKELKRMCSALGWRFQSLPAENGALLYFRAILPAVSNDPSA
jgi:SAM-dependent methyltransferase